jgi:hypothetical protein
MLVIPIVIAFGAAAVLKKIEAPKLDPFKVAAATVIGHSGWMLFALFVKGGGSQVIPDLILMAVGLAWLFAKPGLGAVWYFTIIEGVSVLININLLLHQSFGGYQHKALVAHICLRTFIIVSLWAGLRSARAKTSPPPLPAEPVVQS